MKNRDELLHQLSTGIQAITVAMPALLQSDSVGAAIGLGGVAVVSVIENVLRREAKLNHDVQEALRDRDIGSRVDFESVKVDEFLALYVRAKDTASKSEKEQKLRYIRNFLVNAITIPLSTDPDKERYLRLIDELSFRELEHFIRFCRTAADSNYQTIDQFIESSKPASLMLDAYARSTLGLKVSDRATPELMNLEVDLRVAFRHFESVGLLDPIGMGGETYMYRTNGFSPRFLAFILDPAPK